MKTLLLWNSLLSSATEESLCLWDVNMVADNVPINKARSEKSLKHKETLPSLLTIMRSKARSDSDASLEEFDCSRRRQFVIVRQLYLVSLTSRDKTHILIPFDHCI
ncbi:hypothetical protein BX666DRAFT_1956006 [Dichotomocladium elegans]|nr:hypothetical protein BX666DRAFT_1956006 [Dichotomocladium elegans]